VLLRLRGGIHPARPNDSSGSSVGALRMPRPSGYVTMGRLGLDRHDASLYVVPFAADGERPAGWVGRKELAPGGGSFDITANGEHGRLPKVSLHESGRAHARARGTRSYLGATSPLWDSEGGHVATVLTFNLDRLPALAGPPKALPHVDVLLRIDRQWTSARVAIYAYSEVRRAAEHPTYLTLTRAGLPSPLYVALGFHGDRHDADNRDPGVAVIAGWGQGYVPEAGHAPLICAATS
jgi:hypothetical protein